MGFPFGIAGFDGGIGREQNSGHPRKGGRYFEVAFFWGTLRLGNEIAVRVVVRGVPVDLAEV